MKRIFIILLVIPLLSVTVKIDKAKFIGKWIGEDNKVIGYLNFESDGYAFFEVEGQIIGGMEFIYNGKKGRMTYEINDETNPVEIDLIITNLENKEQKKILCIANLIDEDTMEFVMSFDENRPSAFDSENTIIFKREK